MKRIGCGVVVCALLVGARVPDASASEPADRAASPRTIAPPTRIPDAIVAETPPGSAVTAAEVPRAVRRAVVADAARRFKVAESAVVIARAERVTWPDGALGCPEPGRMYAQALVPGYRLAARTAAGEMLYHTDMRGEVRLCVPSGTEAGGIHQRLRDQRMQPVTTPPASPKPVG